MSDTRFLLERLDTRVGPVASVTIANESGGSRPNTFGEAALQSLDEVLGRLRTRDWRGLLVTGSAGSFGAGADIDEFPEISSERARKGSRAGHELFGRLHGLPFLTLAAINGGALGGGLELALHCDIRTIGADVRHVGFPEVFLGLIPAWGGTQLAPRLVGAEAAVRLVVENPLRQNRHDRRGGGPRARARRPRPPARGAARPDRWSCSSRRSRRAAASVAPTPISRTSPRWCVARGPGSTMWCTARRPRRTGRSS